MKPQTDELLGEAFAIEMRLVMGSREAGARVLRNTSDPYVQVLNLREMTARLKRSVAGVEEFVEAQAACVLEWTERDREEVARLQPRMLQSLQKNASRVLEWLPKQTDLYLTSGAEETGLTQGPDSRIAYCRGLQSVFFSRAYLDWEAHRDTAEHVLMHELWHIVSRNMPPAALDAVYAEFGFRRLPQPLRNLHPWRLSNPDALILEHYMEVEGKSFVPVLMLNPTFNVLSKTETQFDHMLLMVALLTEDRRDFAGPVYELRSNPGLSEAVLRLVGRNTGYLLHVEEAVAVNFAMMVREEHCQDRPKLDQLRRVLHAQ